MLLPREACKSAFFRILRLALIPLAILLGFAPAKAQVMADPSQLNFGDVQIGTKSTLPVVLTNQGSSPVSITKGQIQGSGFMQNAKLPITLNPGQNFTVNVTFMPHADSPYSGTLSGSNHSGPVVSVPVTGTGVLPGGLPGTLSPNPASLNFGSVQVGNNQNLSESVTNTGGSNLTISQVNVSGTGFSVSGITPPVTLTAGQTYTFTATFTPQSVGNASGNITVDSNASNPILTIGLSGTGTAPPAQLSVSPTSLNFGNVVVGTNSQLGGQLNATGGSVTVSSAVSSNAQFTISGLTLPTTIPAGGNATFTVTFTPTAAGSVNATLTFSSNASNSPTVQSLSGTGTAPPVHSVSLSWDPSSSPDITGYNIYRGTTPGGPYSKINSSLDTVTSYTDNAVVDGDTYYYVTTAVNSSNQESGYSNQATAVIPPP